MTPETWFYLVAALLAVLAGSCLFAASRWPLGSSKYPRPIGLRFRKVTLPLAAGSSAVMSAAMLCLGLYGDTGSDAFRTVGVALILVGGGIAAFGVRRFAR